MLLIVAIVVRLIIGKAPEEYFISLPFDVALASGSIVFEIIRQAIRLFEEPDIIAIVVSGLIILYLIIILIFARIQGSNLKLWHLEESREALIRAFLMLINALSIYIVIIAVLWYQIN